MQPNFSPYAQQQQQQQQAPNPYAQQAGVPGYRQNVFVPYGATSEPLVKPTLRKIKLALGILQVVTMLFGITLLGIGAAMGDDAGSVLAAIGGIMLAVWYMLLFGYGIVSVIWVYKFWSWIPPEQRHTSMWKKYISPGTAVGFMFIPYFNLYWMFVVYLGMADIMERMRVQFPTNKPPAKTLAILTLVIPMVFFPAGPILHYMLAKHLEEMAAEMQGRMMNVPAPVAAMPAY